MGKRDTAERTAKKVEQHPAAVLAASVGHVVNGTVHIIIGLIAIGIALGAGGSADQSGAMRAIDSTLPGSIALWVAGIAMFALALYSFATAITDVRSDTWDAVRGVGRGIAYLAVGSVALVYATGGTSDGEQSTETFSATLMQSTWGSWLLAVIGLVILAIGVGMFVKGVRKKFLDDVDVSGTFRRVFVVLGMTGYMAKGVAIAIVGVLFVLAVINRDPDEAGGLDGALKKLTELPYGSAILFVVAAGVIAYGFFCFARARTTARKRDRIPSS
ncbi:DUF1206 domain-containing protein [Tessaracoccus lubricantis]|uniref:DUF1206 domain-containing protein n=1 Tax=Tessaracoccus lubricantis TaxID=545543 RepID=A0ABP9EWE0_9ACTN